MVSSGGVVKVLIRDINDRPEGAARRFGDADPTRRHRPGVRRNI
jgi:hypothetical protein